MKKVLILLAVVLICYGMTTGAKKPTCRTIESRLTPQTRHLLKQIKKSKKDSQVFYGSEKTFKELTAYLNSDSHIFFDGNITVYSMDKVQARIRTVERVNRQLYRRTKKLYRGKSIRTLESYIDFISNKLTYKLPNPDMYRSMKRGTCVAYASMLKVMCDISGIPCRIYAGWNEEGEGHCWNRVRIKKKWYWCDVTYYDNLMYNYLYYSYSRKLWDDHEEYMPIRIYRVSLPY